MIEVQSSKFKVQSFGRFFLTAFLLVAYSLLSALAPAAENTWQGVDESVVEKIAKEHGRDPREPFINTDQGDLLLFAFLVAGAVGGFAAGYYWRKLTELKQKE